MGPSPADWTAKRGMRADEQPGPLLNDIGKRGVRASHFFFIIYAKTAVMGAPLGIWTGEWFFVSMVTPSSVKVKV